MIIKRIGAAVIVGALIHGGVSCGRNMSEPDTTSQNLYVQTSPPVTEPPVFASKDLGGGDFTFLIYNEHASNYVDSYICADSQSGDYMAKSVIERNTDTEERFNINIVADAVHSPKSEVISRIQAGQCDFDVIYEWGTKLSTLAIDGLLCDFNDIDDIHLDRSYWVPTAKDDLAVGGKTYIATSYITMNSLAYADMLYFNKTMYGEIGYTDSLYDSVFSGMWTIERLVDIALSATSDLDGDGEMMSSDRYGFFGSLDDCLTGLAESAGVQNTVRNDDGSYSIDIYNQKVVDIYTNYADKLKTKDNFITYEDIWQEEPNLSDFPTRHVGARFVSFGKGHVMFMPGTLSIAGEFEKMNDDFGILPYPLYDADQRNYCHFIDSNSPMLAIPKDVENRENLGFVLDYMSYMSEQNMLPVFAENVIQSMNNPDPAAEKVLGIIKNSLRYEWTELYNLEVVSGIKKKMMASGSFKSVYNRFYSKAAAEVNGCVDTISLMGIE